MAQTRSRRTKNDDRRQTADGAREEGAESRRSAVGGQRSAVGSQPSPDVEPSGRLGWWVVGAALVFGLVFFALWARAWISARPTAVTTYTNPILNHSFPQPAVIAALDDYWLYSGAPDGSVQVERSPDMVTWSPDGTALVRPGVWADGGVTAPDVITGPRRGYLMYYAARERGGPRTCISLAMSEKPGTEFNDNRETPLVCDATDPHSFVDEDGARYLLWTEDQGLRKAAAAQSSILNPQSSIRLQRLDKDGLQLAGEAMDVLTPTQPWEGNRVSAPTLVKRAGRYFLLYTGGESATSAIGYARADSPLGPFTKATAPLLQTGEAVCAPSGQTVFLDAAGQDWLIYAATPVPCSNDFSRSLVRMDRLNREGDKLTVAPSTTSQVAPMLEK